MDISSVARASEAICREVEAVLLGKEQTVRQAVLTLLCGGHLLIEDVPGVGKTTLAKALARVIGGDFHRIQFTPDLLPSDVTGTSIFNQESRHFEFIPGPVFGNVVLADEINRATPKTQSALLEAMEERQVTSDGVERRLPEPFFVLATQNNVEMMGTFPLPEAQLDRFFGRLSIGYPSREAEKDMLTSQLERHPIESVRPVTTPAELSEMQKVVRTVEVTDSVKEYIVDIVRATREDTLAVLGSSPRGSLNLMHGAQAHALMQGREYATPDDVQAVAVLVLSHRMITRGESRHGLDGSQALIESILTRIAVPVPHR